MGYEIELKFRVPDHTALADRLATAGARADEMLVQEDTYLRHPARDFAQTGEAFRVRRVGDENRITYKGAKHAGPTRTREEIEIPLAEGPDMHAALLRLLACLGFEPVATIHKRRRPFHLEYAGHHLEIVLDEVEGLGTFAEVEALAHGAADLPAAQSAILACAKDLGLTDGEPRSYLRMVLEARQ